MAAYYEARPLLFALLLFSALWQIVVPSKISNLKMCADAECKKTISEASAIKSYHNDDPKFLSFHKNDIIFIKSKSAGRIPYLWSGEANGHVGYFPMSHIKEIQVFIRNPSHLVPTGEDVKTPDEQSKSSSDSEPEVKEIDETEIEEDEPSTVKTEEKKEPAESLPETEKDETEIEEEEEAIPTISEANKQSNTKEDSITQHVDEIMNAYHQINQELHGTNKEVDDTSKDEPIKTKPQEGPSSQISEPKPKFTETTYQSPDIIKDPMQTTHTDVLQQAHQTHSQESVSPTQVHDDTASRLIQSTPVTTRFISKSLYTVFDGTTLFDGVTPGNEAPQTATVSRFAYEKLTEKITQAFVETSVPDQTASSESSRPVSVNIEPSTSPFVTPNSNFNPSSGHDTVIKKTLAMQPDLENVPSRERQREDISKSSHGDPSIGFSGKSVSQSTKQHSSAEITKKAKDNLTTHEFGNLMKVIEVYMKSILDMCPTVLQNFLEQELLGIPPTLLLFYIIFAISFSLLFIVICTCFSSPTQKPRTDPVVIIRNLEEKLFVITKEKENLEDDVQAMKENVSILQQNVELQKTSTGSVESDLQHQKLLNEEMKAINDSLIQQLSHLKTEYEDFKCQNKKKYKKLHTLEEEKVKLTNEYKTICEKHLELTEELTGKETENSGLQSRVVTLADQIQHLETRKQQLLEEAEQWTEKCRELTENWEQSKADYVKVRETLDFKENELEQMKECFLQLKAFEDESEEAASADYVVTPLSLQDKIQSMLDVSRVKAMWTAAEEEKNALQQSRQIEVECRMELEDQIEALKHDVETLQADKTKAIRQNNEAQTKLNVLTTYFKEKEMQFQRELGEHEILKKQSINKLGTAEEKAKSIESELESYKSQIQDLKQEINKAERDFRAQIAANEKKAHENWLATRAAERELKEARIECTMLRQKLTDLERRPMPGSIIRPLPTRGSGHSEMVNGPPLLPRFPPGDHPAGRKDLLPPTRDDQSKPQMKSPSPNFRSPRPSPPNFRPPPPMKKRGPPPPPPNPNMSDVCDAFPPWQMPPPRLSFGNRPPPPPPSSKVNLSRGSGHPFAPPPPLPPSMMTAPPRPLPDFSSLPDKHSTCKQHSQV